MRGAGQAGIEQTDAAADRRLSGLGKRAPLEVSFGQVLDDEVDQRIVELGCHQQLQSFDLTPVDGIAVDQKTPGGFDDADAFPALV